MLYNPTDFIGAGETVLGTAISQGYKVTLTNKKVIHTGNDYFMIVPLNRIAGIRQKLRDHMIEIATADPDMAIFLSIHPGDGDCDGIRALCRELSRRIG